MTRSNWNTRHVLITGGLGFIGSNLAHALVHEDARVTIYDAELPEYGSNPTNVSEIRGDVRVVTGDVRDREELATVVADVDTVFHCAAQLSRPVSLENPTKDVAINCTGLINLLEAAASRRESPRIVYLSSQAVVGKSPTLPLDEETPANPVDIYGANKLVGEHYSRIYTESKAVPTVTARLSNVYGPRAQLQNPSYGVFNRFLSLALRDRPLEVFEPGTMERDFVYVKDVVEALLELGTDDGVVGERYVVSSGSSTSIRHLAELIVDETGQGEVVMKPWPEEWDEIRVGDVRCDTSKIRTTLGWEPETDLREGIRRTVAYYEEHQDAYL